MICFGYTYTDVSVITVNVKQNFLHPTVIIFFSTGFTKILLFVFVFIFSSSSPKPKERNKSSLDVILESSALIVGFNVDVF